MDLYFAPMACSMASRIVLYEAEAPARFVQVDTKHKRLADGSDFLRINPLGQVPVLRREDGSLLTENGAILQEIARGLPRAGLLGAEADLPELQRWLSFVGTELHKAVYTPLLSAKASQGAKDSAHEAAGPRFDVLEAHLAGRAFLLDAFTVADAYLTVVLNWSPFSGIDLARWPAVKAYHAKMLARPAVARAVREERALYAEEQAKRAA